ncbi:MAG: DciA family protein [Phycisphaerae bacterium]
MGGNLPKKPTVASIARIISYRKPKSARTTESLGDILPTWFAREVLKPARTMDFLTPTWNNLPELLRRSCTLKGIHRSVLTITCEQAPARTELERLLRNGLLARIQAASHGRIKRVKVILGHPTTPSE